jgi:hypothetical protein
MANEFNSLPVGDVQFLDNLIPALAAGNYTIQVAQTLSGIDTGDLGTTQAFVVAAPQVSVDAIDVNSTYPPQNLTGQYGDVLPHIVLNEALLPWERPLDGNDRSIPWMALLIFSPDELAGDSDQPTKVNASTVGAYTAAPPSNVFRPTITPDADVTASSALNTVQIPIALFNQIAPHKDELSHLAHVRALNMGDKSTSELSGTGIYSVVVANRFPVASASDPLGQQNIAHLVSLEGMSDYLSGSANFGSGKDTLELISLYAWTFRTLPDPSADFQGLMQAMVAEEGPAGSQVASKLLMRLPSTGVTNSTLKSRLDAGYVPLNYLTRSGEQTYAWFRGPFAPSLAKEFTTPGQFQTSDAAVIYDQHNGIFDLSLSAAWQVGRTMALSNKAFGAALLTWRQSVNAALDRLVQIAMMHPQANTNIPDIDATHFQQQLDSNYFRQQFDSLLASGAISAVGQPGNAVHGGGNGGSTTPMLGAGTPYTIMVQAVESAFSSVAVSSAINTATSTELAPVVQWLARLALLYDVPFNNIVADARLLPPESLRFFYFDDNWGNALRDGALSIAQHSSRDTQTMQANRDFLENEVERAMAAYRATLLGADTDPSGDGITHISGFLMRSAIVSGWPGLSVQGFDAAGNALKVLRQDHVSSDVLLVLFWGTPSKLQLTEPQEGFRFGVNQDGQIELRKLSPTANLGDPLQTFAIRKMDGTDGLYMRPGTGARVLNLSPGSSSGLVQAIAAALNSAGVGQPGALGSAAFALQMINAPMQQTFTPPVVIAIQGPAMS